MRVGFASVDGRYVNEHFGHSKYWEIYDISENEADVKAGAEHSCAEEKNEDNIPGVTYIGTRMVRSGCNCHDPKLFDDMLVTLGDCDILIVSRIGQEAAEYVISKGMRVFEAAGGIKEIADRLKESICISAAE